MTLRRWLDKPILNLLFAAGAAYQSMRYLQLMYLGIPLKDVLPILILWILMTLVWLGRGVWLLLGSKSSTESSAVDSETEEPPVE